MTKKEYKEKLAEINEEFDDLIFDDKDRDRACQFVAKLIGLEIDRMEANESYATVSIREHQKMESEVYSFYDDTIRHYLEERWKKA